MARPEGIEPPTYWFEAGPECIPPASFSVQE